MNFKKISAVLLISCLIWVSPVSANRIALVIGNNNYQEQPLTNPVNDASAINKVLHSIGFQVIKANNVDRDSFEDALARFGQLAEGAEIALVYYAGHAIQVDGENYMIPVGTPVNHRRDLRKLINLKDMMAEVKVARGLGLVLVDACRTNPFSERLTRQMGRSVGGRGLARVEDTPGNVMVGFSAKDGEIALDGKGGNSPYAKALIAHLPQKNLEVRHLLGKVRDSVLRITGQQQKPFTYGTLGGDLWYLAGTEAGGGTPVLQGNSRQAFEPEMVDIPGRNYVMGKYEVTFAQWDACVVAGACKHKPGDEGWGRGDRPVINVSWDDVQGYIQWLNQKTGKQYRLPTEQEWEHAAHAGSKTDYPWGDSISCEQADYRQDGSSCHGRGTSVVGSFPSNDWGLHDTVGNVWEWTSSEGDSSGVRVLRGGSWYNFPRYVRSAFRNGLQPSFRSYSVGFRLSRTP